MSILYQSVIHEWRLIHMRGGSIPFMTDDFSLVNENPSFTVRKGTSMRQHFTGCHVRIRQSHSYLVKKT